MSTTLTAVSQVKSTLIMGFLVGIRQLREI